MTPFKKDRRIGSTDGKRGYDLPLNRDEGSSSLTLLLALMTFMAAMTLAGAFAIGSMATRWSSGLENKMTVEIPAEMKNGTMRGASDMARLQVEVKKSLDSAGYVTRIEILSPEEVQDLIEPWLGHNAQLDDVPLPGLVSVETDASEDAVIENLRTRLHKIDESIELDTHESWLNDLLRLTNSLRFASLVLAIIIGAATASAIAGAIKSRVAVYRADVELLHFMGASDYYIMRQFRRHAVHLALKGSLIGMAGSIAALAIIGFISGDLSESILPVPKLSIINVAFIIALPLAACIIGAATARFTVMRVLSHMP
ncbi:MAG: cell division protein FtsX [Alphaproteobacteria bacterium]